MFMEENRAYIIDEINKYKADFLMLLEFLPWLTKVSGQDLTNMYTPEQAGPGTIKVPVYDTNLLRFVKIVQKTQFMNKNYVYTYSRYRIRDYRDELRLIEKAEVKDFKILGDILSMYIMKGMRKGVVWNQGIEYGVYEKIIVKMKELIEYWTSPM